MSVDQKVSGQKTRNHFIINPETVQLTRGLEVVALVVETERSGSAVPDDVDLVPVSVVQSAVRSPEPERPAPQVQVQVQEPFEQLQREEVPLRQISYCVYFRPSLMFEAIQAVS